PVVAAPELATAPGADPRLLKGGAARMIWRAVPTWAALALTGLGFAAGYLLGQRPPTKLGAVEAQPSGVPAARAETARSEPSSQRGATAQDDGTPSDTAPSSA